MSAEQPDRTEPASFYVPGAEGWDDPRLRGLRARRRVLAEEVEERLYPAPEYDEYEEQ